MAVDEALLDSASESDVPTLRFYQWARPTLSLGYFQSYAQRWTHLPSKDADVVRRLSGGGAIVHDRELTYSLVLPASHRLSRDTQSLYDVVHQTLVKVLGTFFTARPTLCEQALRVPVTKETFLCFQRRAMGDILLRPLDAEPQTIAHKVVGSAQRRRRGAVLQHGSILLDRSTAAPELSGIETITGKKISASTLLTQLPDALAEALSLRLRESRLPQKLSDKAAELQKSKFENPDWTERR